MMGKKDEKPHILVFAPTPPPYAGPEVATQMLLNAVGNIKVKITYYRSNVRDDNWKKGNFDFEGVISFLKIYAGLIRCIFTAWPDKIYFLLSSSKVGFIRDSVIILTSKLFGKKLVGHYRGGNFHNFYGQQNFIFKWFIRYSLVKIDCLIVQGNVLKSTFAGLVPEKRMRVLYNGIELNKSNIIRTNDENKPFVIFYMGHIAFSKGFFELVLAFRQLRKKYDVKLNYAGTKIFSGEKRKSIRGFLSDAARDFYDKNTQKIEKTISDFVGDQHNKNSCYLGVISGSEKERAFLEADLFVLPSYTEGFSMSVLEAMSYGLPVIVTPVGAFPEIIKDGVNGYFVQQGNSMDIDNKIERLILNPQEVRKIGENNRKYVRDQFSIDLIAQQFEDILLNA